jgi:hypothetical protein
LFTVIEREREEEEYLEYFREVPETNDWPIECYRTNNAKLRFALSRCSILFYFTMTVTVGSESGGGEAHKEAQNMYTDTDCFGPSASADGSSGSSAHSPTPAESRGICRK